MKNLKVFLFNYLYGKKKISQKKKKINNLSYKVNLKQYISGFNVFYLRRFYNKRLYLVKFFFFLPGVDPIFLFITILGCFVLRFNLIFYGRLFKFFQVFYLRKFLQFYFYFYFIIFSFMFQLFLKIRYLKRWRIKMFIEAFLEYNVSFRYSKLIKNSFFSELFKSRFHGYYYSSNTFSWLELFGFYNQFFFSLTKRGIKKPKKYKLLQYFYAKRLSNFLFLRKNSLKIVVSLSYNNFFITVSDFFGNPFLRLTKAIADSSFFRKRSPLLVEYLVSEMVDRLILDFSVNQKVYKSSEHKRLVTRLLSIIKVTQNTHSFLNLKYLKFLNNSFRQFFFKFFVKFITDKGPLRSAKFYIRHFTQDRARKLPISLRFFKKKIPFNGCRLRKQRRL